MIDAPQVAHDQSIDDRKQFKSGKPKVDAYWKAHLFQKSSN